MKHRLATFSYSGQKGKYLVLKLHHDKTGSFVIDLGLLGTNKEGEDYFVPVPREQIYHKKADNLSPIKQDEFKMFKKNFNNKLMKLIIREIFS